MNLQGLPQEWRDLVLTRSLLLGLPVAEVGLLGGEPRPLFLLVGVWSTFVGVLTMLRFRKDSTVAEPFDCAFHMAWIAFMGALFPLIIIGGFCLSWQRRG